MARSAVAAACLLVAGATVMRSRQVRDESAAPHIALYEGRIFKQTAAQVPPARARTAAYFYAFEGAHLPVGPEGYEVLEPADIQNALLVAEDVVKWAESVIARG